MKHMKAMPDIIEFLTVFFSENAHRLGLLSRNDVRDVEVIMRLPTASHTGRILFMLHSAKESLPFAAAQIVPLIAGKRQFSNPYCPSFDGVLFKSLADVLPTPTGVVSFDERAVCWARYYNWTSLAERIKDHTLLAKVCERFFLEPFCVTGKQSRQSASTNNSDGQEDAFRQITLVLRGSIELLHNFRRVQLLFESTIDRMAFSFSHGDISCQRILCSSNNELCFLDWEWASAKRPAGLDLFCLAVSACEYLYGLNTQGDAVTTLIWGKGGPESYLRQELIRFWDGYGYDYNVRYITLIYYLVHMYWRLSRQYGKCRSYWLVSIEGVLEMVLKNKCYAAPLVHQR